MNYCKKCGSKIKQDSKFCKNCGYKLTKNEVNNENLILIIGICLVIFSSILFAFISWKNLNNLFKIIFLLSEVIVFFILSMVSKKLKNNFAYKSCYLIFALFLPISLYLIKYHNLIPMFKEDFMLFVYLSIISLISSIVYLVSAIKVSKNYFILLDLSIISLVVYILKIFNVDMLIINYIVLLTVILIDLFSIKLEKKYLINIITIINTLFIISIVLSLSENLVLLLIASSILIAYYVFSLYIKSYKVINYILLFLSILLFTYTLNELIFHLNYLYIFLENSILAFIISIIFNKSKSFSIVTLLFYISYLTLLTSLMFTSKDFIVTILSLLLWAIYYLYNIKKKIFPIFLIGMIYSLLNISTYYNLNYLYYILFISFILFATYEIIKKEDYLVAGSVFMMTCIFGDFNERKLIFIVIALLFVYAYTKIAKLENKKVLNILINYYGLLMIYRIISELINVSVIVSIITLFIYFVVLVTFYLSEKESNKNILLYSLVTLIPYYIFINNIDILSSLHMQLLLIIIIVYSFAFDIVFEIKDKSVLIVLNIIVSLLCISASKMGIIFSVLLSIFYLIYGLCTKRKEFIIYGIVYLVITILVGLYTIINNYVLLILLIIVGVAFIIYAIYKESKKEKKNEIKK